MSDFAHKLDRLFTQALTDQVFPGAELLFTRRKEVIAHQAWGKRSLSDNKELRLGAWFDLASLTKPLVTGTSLLLLAEEGELFLSDRLAHFLPSFNTGPMHDVTLMDLITHRSGLSAWEPLFEPHFNKTEALARLMKLQPQSQPRSQVVYSCLNYLLLAQVVRKVTKMSLQEYFKQKVILPFQLEGLSFAPPRADCPPTSYCSHRKRLLQGEVQDQNAALFGEDAGNAGLFGTALGVWDLAQAYFDQPFRFAKPLFSPVGQALAKRNQNPLPLFPRAIGWDYRHQQGYQSAGDFMPLGSLGHLGFTGTSCWFHPSSGVSVILLTHRVQIDIQETTQKIRNFRPRLHNLLLSHLDFTP